MYVWLLTIQWLNWSIYSPSQTQKNYIPANEDVHTQHLYSPQLSVGVNYDKRSGYIHGGRGSGLPVGIEANSQGNRIEQSSIHRNYTHIWTILSAQLTSKCQRSVPVQQGWIRDGHEGGWVCSAPKLEIWVYILSQSNNWCSQSLLHLEKVFQWYSSWGTSERKILKSLNQSCRGKNTGSYFLRDAAQKHLSVDPHYTWWTPISFKLYGKFLCNLQNVNAVFTVAREHNLLGLQKSSSS